MAIRLWPQDYERKEHITKAEKSLLRNAARNFKSGHIAVSIDPVGMSTATVKMGMYISPNEGSKDAGSQERCAHPRESCRLPEKRKRDVDL